MSNKTNIPQFATHYHHSSDPPFKNLSELDQNELVIVLEKLKRRRKAEPTNKRVFGSAYMQFRAETETKMRELFIARGGAPERKYPHYFVLGECPWFANLYPASEEVRISLLGLDPKGRQFYLS